MNIKSKLTWRFLLTVSMIWLVASCAIYFSAAEFRKEEFYDRLRSRATAISRLLIEVDEVDAELLRKMESISVLRLPQEKISIFDFENTELFTTDTADFMLFNTSDLNHIRLDKYHEWTQNQHEALGILYEGPYDRYVTIASAYDEFGWRKLNNLRNILLIVFFLMAFILWIAGRYYARKALEPVTNIVRQVKKIGATNLNQRVDEGNKQDELGQLAITFNEMLSRLQKAFESQRSFISHASHELRTPLTTLLSQIDVALLKPRDQLTYKQTIVSLREDVKALSQLNEKLLMLAKGQNHEMKVDSVRIDNLVWQVLEEIRKIYPQVAVKTEIGEGLDDELFTVRGNEALLRSALSNLLDNSCKYSNSQVSIRMQQEANFLSVTFVDDGIGIPERDQPHIRQPFFRAANVTSIKGHGIGLSLAAIVADSHSGLLEIRSVVNQGTEVDFMLPIAKF